MGAWSEYECDSCGYNALVSGGLDIGFEAVVQTVTCGSCHQISDALIGVRGKVLWPDNMEAILDQSSFEPDQFGVCTECGSDDVKRWPKSQPCPKCDGKMKCVGAGGLWD